MTVLIVGGAGYIGSHMAHYLCDINQAPIVLDNLSTGVQALLPDCEFIHGDLADQTLLDSIFTQHKISAVMHFAAHIEVGESVIDPAKYYRNNVIATQQLLESMLEHNIKQFIFSSTAAIFGAPEYTPIDEEHPKHPINPYGYSKLMVEQILSDYDNAYDFKSICLRYFNAAGADPSGRTGECHQPETHLIPLILQAASARRESISIFGTDYDTLDGTCVRDYIHVCDLCQAHYLALEYLQTSNQSAQFNLGNGQGFSVKQVIESVERVTGIKVNVIEAARRAGDPPTLVADSSLVKQRLNWQASFSQLDEIVEHAWQWEQNYLNK